VISFFEIVITILLLIFHGVLVGITKMFISDLDIAFFKFTKTNWKYFKYAVLIPGVPFIYIAIFLAIVFKDGLIDAWKEFSREE